ncbi:MAG TPA: hypothetical protein VGN97_01480 [Mesorhizobium sp.]|jgi:hypothetical protein|nr:hypothetical protein [Mesorhizobium sp.]
MLSRTKLAAFALLIAPAEALAITQLQTPTASCEQVQSLLEVEGAAILRWRSARRPDLPRYDRFVSSSRFCTPGEGAFAAFVPTADDPNCQVYECRKIEFDDPILQIPQR